MSLAEGLYDTPKRGGRAASQQSLLRPPYLHARRLAPAPPRCVLRNLMGTTPGGRWRQQRQPETGVGPKKAERGTPTSVPGETRRPSHRTRSASPPAANNAHCATRELAAPPPPGRIAREDSHDQAERGSRRAAIGCVKRVQVVNETLLYTQPRSGRGVHGPTVPPLPARPAWGRQASASLQASGPPAPHGSTHPGWETMRYIRKPPVRAKARAGRGRWDWLKTYAWGTTPAGPACLGMGQHACVQGPLRAAAADLLKL